MSKSTDFSCNTLICVWVSCLWNKTFEKLLDDELDYGHRWSLSFNYDTQTNEVTKEEQKRGWKVHTHHAFGKFKCRSCSHTWSSAKILVLFRYRLRGNQGTVIMRPFRQACSFCRGDFYPPGFSEKDVEESLHRLICKIRKNCYGEKVDGGAKGSSEKKHTKPHRSDLCEACTMGILCENAD